MRPFIPTILSICMSTGLATAGSALAAEAVDPAVLSGRLPPAVLKKLRAAPDRFLAEAAAVIYATSGPDGASAAEVESTIALERAGLRAKEMRRLLAGDLDNDGAVAAAELDTLAAAQSAGARAALRMAAVAADGNADGAISAAELRTAAQAVALDRLPEAEATARMALLAFDLDGNGRVAVAEVAEGVTLIATTE